MKVINLKICQLCAVDFTLKKFLLPLVDGQTNAGHHVISVCSKGEYTDQMRSEGYEIYSLNVTRSMNLLSHARSIWKLYHYFRKQQFDVVHVHTPVAALVGRIAAKLARVPCIVYTAHGFYFHEDMPWAKRVFHESLEKFAGMFTDLLFTQSAEDAQSAVKLRILDEQRIFPIGNGVDLKKFILPDSQKMFVRDQLGIPDSAFVIGMIGRQVEEKGIVEFLQAARSIHNKYHWVHFLLIGGRLDSDHSQAVDLLVSDAMASIGDNLHVLGMRDDVPQLLAVMDVFVLPS